MIAAVESSRAQTAQATPPNELRITNEGRVVAGQTGAPKIPDRIPAQQAPSRIQMVFDAQPTEQGVAACAPSRAMSADAAEALVRRVAEAENFYPDFVIAVARRESGFDVTAASRAGAYGLMQLTAATAERFDVDRCDPEENVRGGIRFLRQLWERLRNPFYILAAYNAGEEAVATHKGVPPYPETVAFVAAVISDFYGYPPIGAPSAGIRQAAQGSPAASTAASATPAALSGRERQRAAPFSARRPSPASSPQTRKAPPAQDWMVLHLE